jgi:hypothetical protein
MREGMVENRRVRVSLVKKNSTICPVVVDRTMVESLILAQDERWRRA